MGEKEAEFTADNADNADGRGKYRYQISGFKLPLFKQERRSSIKPFVGFVEGGDRDVDDLELADGAVAAAGLDVHGRHGLERDQLAVELHLTLPFEHQIDFGHAFVVVRARVGLDLDAVNAGGIAGLRKGAFRPPTGAPRRGNIVELRDHEIWHVAKLTEAKEKRKTFVSIAAPKPHRLFGTAEVEQNGRKMV